MNLRPTTPTNPHAHFFGEEAKNELSQQSLYGISQHQSLAR